MKKILLLVILSVLVLASCKAPEPIIIEKPAEVVCPAQYMRIGTTCCLDANANNICDSDEEIEAEEETPVKPTTETTELLMSEKLYAKAKNAIKIGYGYDVFEEKFFIRDNKMKVLFGDYVNLGYDYKLMRLNLVDTAYLDLVKKSAFGVCSGRFFKSKAWDKTCTALEGKAFQLYYNDYYYKTPMDWLKQYRSKLHTYFREYDKEVLGTMADVIVFDDGATMTTMWLDHDSGLPVRINTERKRDKWTVAFYEYEHLFFYVEPNEVNY